MRNKNRVILYGQGMYTVCLLANDGKELSTQGDFSNDLTRKDFIEWLEGDVKEMGYKSKDITILSCEYTGPIESDNISFYVAECSEIPSLGEYHEGLNLAQAVKIYTSIPSDRMNGVKSLGFVIDDESLLINEFDLVVGDRLNIDLMKDLWPSLAEHPLVMQAVDDIRQLMDLF